MKRTLTCLALVLAGCTADDGPQRLVGQMESDRVEIVAETAEPIVERAVVEGQTVDAGQLLIVQDTTRVDARVAEAEAQLAQVKARLDELTRGPRREQIEAARASVDGAVKEFEFRETDLKRIQDLLDRELASPELRDRARAARDAAEANLDTLEARLDELLSGTTVEELRQAEAAVRLAEARLASVEIDRERHTAVAPAAAVVDSLLFEPGERPTAGRPMAILLTGPQAYARVFVPEAMRARVQPGQRAQVYVDGIAEPLDGVIRWISRDAAFTPYFALTETDRGRLSYPAKIDLDDTTRRIPDGIPVEVELLFED
jgi:HlyD family secretion protein